jgi:hypothetical protein
MLALLINRAKADGQIKGVIPHLVDDDLSIFEDHVWFEDRWMVASLCDELLTTLCGLILG